jgi:hypothetical protein
MKTYAQKAADLIAKCARQDVTSDRCHLDDVDQFQACPHHLRERIEANRRVASVLGCNGDAGSSEQGTWSTDLASPVGVQQRVPVR